MNLVVPAIFLLVLAIILIAYWAFVLRVDQADEATLKRRLAPDPGANIPKKLRILKPIEKLSSVEQFDSVLSRFGRFTDPIQRDITQAGLNITVGTLLLASACLAVGGFLIVRMLTIYSIVAVTVGVMLAFVPFIWLRYKKNSRLRKFEEQFPEAIDLIGRALRAGHAFTTGIAMAAEEIPAPVGEEFKLLYDRQNFGMPLPDALKAFAARIPIIDARFFVTAVLTQRETGGNLGEVLDNLASVIRDRFRVKRQVRVLTAHGRITGWILAGLPPGLAVAMMVTSPGHLDTMISDPLGIQMIVVALVLQVLGTLIIRKLVDIPY